MAGRVGDLPGLDAADRQPLSTSFAIGQETFPFFPDFVKDEKTTPLTLMQHICMSEYGYVFLKKDGTLVFQDRHTRVKDATVHVTIDEDALFELKHHFMPFLAKTLIYVIHVPVNFPAFCPVGYGKGYFLLHIMEISRDPDLCIWNRVYYLNWVMFIQS